MSLFDDTVFAITQAPTKMADSNNSPAPTPNLRASNTAAPTLDATTAPTITSSTAATEAPTLASTSANNDDVAPTQGTSSSGGSKNNNAVLDGDTGVLTSLRYYDQIRSDATSVERKPKSNVDLLPDENIAICHISHITSFTHGDYTPTRVEVEDAYSVALALHHLNVGDGSIVPQVAGLPDRCNVRFTVEYTDDQDQGGVSLAAVVEQTSRVQHLPCAFIGNSRSSVSIPTSIVTGFLGYPQISGYSTSVELDDPSQYPLFGRTIPSDVGNSVPIIKFMVDVLQLEHLVVINVNDAYGNAFVDGLRMAADEYAPSMNIHQIPLDEGQGSIELVVQQLKLTNYRFVFCVVFTQELNDALMTEAVKQGVAGNGVTNWIYGDSFTGLLDGRTFEKDSVLAKAYQGVGLMEAAGGVPGMPSYDAYQKQMMKLKDKIDLKYVGALLPNHTNPNYPASYKENPFIYRDDFLNPVTNTYSPFHYEAAIALGLAACQASNEMETLAITGKQQYDAFLNTTFEGIGGTVKFDPVTGTRLPTSTLYRVTNWVEEHADNNMIAMKPVTSTLFVNGVWEERNPYVFNDGTTKLPADIAPPPPDKNLALLITLPIVAALILIAAMFMWMENKRRQNDSVWKVDREELKFSDPPVIIGQGTFGTVLLGEYRGTQVAVKHVIPARGSEGTSRETDHSRSSDGGSDMDDEDEEMGGSGGRGRNSWAGASVGTMSTTNSKMKSGMTSQTVLHKSSSGGKSRESQNAMRRRLRAEFMEEMRYLSKLRHPCVTTIMGAVVDREDPMMIMEYMDHGSLYDLLHNETVALEGDMLLNFLKDITQGVRFLHLAIPQVIHGDLKAANILVDNRFRAKVADFGLSQKKNLGGTGTPFWMAPELLRKESANTAATDVFSFGIILYEVYSRRDPYEGEDARVVLKGIIDKKVQKRPPALRNMCDQVKQLMSDCLEDSPMMRPTFEELDTRLKRVNAEEIIAGGESRSKGTVSLFDIFPRHIAEALRDGRQVEPEQRDIVTIFFSDIVGFTDISSTLEPRKVATMLDRLYTKFDHLSQVHEIFKLETIGDAYVAVTNLVKDQPDDHAKRIAEFAIDAIVAANETLVDVDDPAKGYVNIRVGFHCGPVVADVVGTRNPRYCLFGDAVNTASRMESNSKENRIHCSDIAATVLREQCPQMALRSRGKIKIKGKGEMRTWWVNEGVGQRRLSRDGTEEELIINKRMNAVREEPSAELLAEKPSVEFELKKFRSSSSIPEDRRSNISIPEFKQSFSGIPEEKDSTEPPLQETAPEPVASPPPAKQIRTHTFEAPPGKLGIVIDTSGGTPKVYQVHHMSAIRQHIAVGDIVCEIDGVNTRRMSHTEISSLMVANAGHTRKFKIERMVDGSA
ncbi:hypothetical protein MPSEU_000627600 [Mayamaea pseudoterrestris]|nr:hypothetical protein MPSEU_000627600 [Mayamaea pseudoterrestris]